jgi:two-component system sensor histidine kinase EvgS
MRTTQPAGISELLALAVHEFRTPVTVVSGYLRMLEQLGPLTDRQKSAVSEAVKSCARLTGLVAEMSDLSNLATDGGAPGDDELALGMLVREVAATVDEGRDRGVTVALEGEDTGGGGALVSADRTRLRDALRALLVAVLREQGAPSTVTVHTDPRIVNGARMAALGIGPADSARAVLDVDRGEARLNESRGGLGLALPIARRVIERSGGHVWSSGTEKSVGAVAVLLPLKESHS